ncbi:B12-binding domain-containing protein [Janibacter sp. GXQ6167]|uniref:cobalamin B12-binding domain-containing protein n=1 Tax=Janibacter sp. GXQ6167 TaxID=3240791 RepID=UPI003524CD67
MTPQAVVDPARAILDAAGRLDQVALRSSLDAAVDQFGVTAAVTEVMIPALHRIGEDWASGRLGVMHEHLLSRAIATELDRRSSYEPTASARTALLACPPRELHDLPLLMASLLLQERGWSTVVLGASTPWPAIGSALRTVRPDVCILAATRPTAFAANLTAVGQLARRAPVYLGGPASTRVEQTVEDVHVLPLDLADAVTYLDTVALPAHG